MIYKCEKCGEEFEFVGDRTKDDIIRELKRIFPGTKAKSIAIVCDDCYSRLTNKLAFLACTVCGKVYPANSDMWSMDKDATEYCKKMGVTEASWPDVELLECNDCCAVAAARMKAQAIELLNLLHEIHKCITEHET